MINKIAEEGVDQSNSIANKQKSRNLSIYEFFRILQLECVVAELRAKIYPKVKDKDYWKNVYENKKITIIDIASRNKVNNQPLPSIFTDDDILKEIKDEIFGQGGYPKFIYKNKDQENSQGYLDHQCYYAKNSDVLCSYFGESKIGKVKFHQPQSKLVTVIIPDVSEEVQLPISEVTRIL
jgi:hypothetical protein